MISEIDSFILTFFKQFEMEIFQSYEIFQL